MARAAPLPRRRRRQRAVAILASFLAVAMLSLAVARSTVMQVQASAPGGQPLCSMAPIGRSAGKSRPAAPAKSCGFCAAAAHAPVLGSVPSTITFETADWAAWPRIASLGARGPPVCEPRARGPPAPLSAA